MQLKNKQQTVLSSDWHYGHKNMERLCNRPFGFEALIHNHLVNYVTWLKFAGHDVTVINMGDVCWSKQSRELVKNTNQDLAVEDIILVKGNHDHLTTNQYQNLGFTKVTKEYQFRYEDKPVIITHAPFDINNNIILPKYIYLNGHLHQNYPKENNGHILISQELMDYRPITLEEVLTIGATPKWNGKEFVSIYDYI